MTGDPQANRQVKRKKYKQHALPSVRDDKEARLKAMIEANKAKSRGLGLDEAGPERKRVLPSVLKAKRRVANDSTKV